MFGIFIVALQLDACSLSLSLSLARAGARHNGTIGGYHPFRYDYSLDASHLAHTFREQHTHCAHTTQTAPAGMLYDRASSLNDDSSDQM